MHHTNLFILALITMQGTSTGQMGPFRAVHLECMRNDRKTLLAGTARHESTRRSSRQMRMPCADASQAMSPGVSATGDNLNNEKFD